MFNSPYKHAVTIRILLPFNFVSFLKGSTVNMNIMGWVYSRVGESPGFNGYTTLGTSLMIGK